MIKAAMIDTDEASCHPATLPPPTPYPRLVDAGLQEATQVSKKRKGDYTVKQVRLVTDDARQYGAPKGGEKTPKRNGVHH